MKIRTFVGNVRCVSGMKFHENTHSKGRGRARKNLIIRVNFRNFVTDFNRN